MTTIDERELHETFQQLDREPTGAEIHALLQAARKERRRRNPAPALVAATAVAAGVAIVLLPGEEPDERAVAPTAATLLQEAADAAQEQPALPAFSGYRYVDKVEWLRYGPGKREPRYSESEQRVEMWVDKDWRGRVKGHRGEHEGYGGGSAAAPYERRYAWGDTPKAYPAELAGDPERLRAQIADSLGLEDCCAGGLPDGITRDDMMWEYVLWRTVNLLEHGNTTPELRAGLWGVVALAPGARAAPEARDPLGRAGSAVKIPVNGFHGTEYTVIFDPATSELLYWSLLGANSPATPERKTTVVRTAHVAEMGDRGAGR